MFCQLSRVDPIPRDHLGSIREITGTNGVVLDRYAYDPYGQQTQLTGTMVSDFGYTGQYYHQRSGLNLAPYREYSASLGRWISRDPLGEAGGINLYDYVGNAPVNFVDPKGEFLIGAVVGGVVGAISGATGAYGTSNGNIGDTIVGGVLGGLFGAALGTIDPTEGIGTVGYLALAGGAAGLGGDLIGQAYGARNTPCKKINWGEAAGATIGGALGGAIGGGFAGELAAAGVGELGQAFAGSVFSASISTFSGYTGQQTQNVWSGSH